MKKTNILKSFLLLMSVMSNSVQAKFLTPEEINDAHILAKSPTKFEDHTEGSVAGENKGHWLTLEQFSYINNEGKTVTCYVGNSFSGSYGEIALYPGIAIEEEINLTSPGTFNDIRGERYVSVLNYKYSTEETPHFIIDTIRTAYDMQRNNEGKWNNYDVVCLRYFMNKFVSERTNVTHVKSTPNQKGCVPEINCSGYTFNNKGTDGYMHWYNIEEKAEK